MEKTNNYSQLVKIIQEIGQILARAEENGSLPAIEKDIIGEKLRTVYEQIIFEDLQEWHTEPDGKTETITAEKDIPHAPIQPEIAKEAPENHFPELSLDASHVSTAEQESPGREKLPEPSPAEKTRKKKTEIIADRLHPQYSFKNETLGQQHPKHDLSSKLQSKPLSDISKAIGINDKFHFIRELFNGDSALYEKTIKTLNESHNFNEAFSFLSRNFNWDMDDPSVLKLLDLTRRKFISPEYE